MRIGVLSLQGDYLEHISVLSYLGIDSLEVKGSPQLELCDGLIIPGGESTVIAMLSRSVGLHEPLVKLLADGLPVFGTCAGMILLAKDILDGRDDQFGLGAIDIAVRRNGFGRQIKSFEANLEIPSIGADSMKAIFIRAPVIESVGVDVEVLGSVEYAFADGTVRSVPAVCRNGTVLATSFHPELTADSRLHEYFSKMVASL